MQELTFSVVGIDLSNAMGSNQRFEVLMTLSGEPIELLAQNGADVV